MHSVADVMVWCTGITNTDGDAISSDVVVVLVLVVLVVVIVVVVVVVVG